LERLFGLRFDPEILRALSVHHETQRPAEYPCWLSRLQSFKKQGHLRAVLVTETGHRRRGADRMTLPEAFDLLRELGTARAVDRWGNEALQCAAVQDACSVALDGLGIDHSGNPAENTDSIAHMLWLVAVAFEAGRISEGGIPA